MTTFKIKAKRVATGVVVGAILALLILFIPLYFDLGVTVKATDLASRIAFGFRNCFVLGACLAIVILIIARQRQTNPQAIDGQTTLKGSIEINRRILQNTLEQVVVAFIAYMTFVVVAPSTHLGILPIFAGWWVICRLLFFVGYHAGDNARAIGFASTFEATVILLIYDAWYLLSMH